MFAEVLELNRICALSVRVSTLGQESVPLTTGRFITVLRSPSSPQFLAAGEPQSESRWVLLLSIFLDTSQGAIVSGLFKAPGGTTFEYRLVPLFQKHLDNYCDRQGWSTDWLRQVKQILELNLFAYSNQLICQSHFYQRVRVAVFQ